VNEPDGRTIEKINRMDHATFLANLGPIYEKSPWIAEAAFGQRPFADAVQLLEVMKGIVEAAGEGALLELLRAHPDLAARLEERASLTAESLSEQTQAGLLNLSEEESERLRQLNGRYRERFGFPFIICARLNQPGTILAALESRVERDRTAEMQEAWTQVQRIAELRLGDLCARL
jgi:2-oxo-4-hydroxy-4-carboxy-5-ureidoimidazoline decarboxylase